MILVALLGPSPRPRNTMACSRYSQTAIGFPTPGWDDISPRPSCAQVRFLVPCRPSFALKSTAYSSESSRQSIKHIATAPLELAKINRPLEPVPLIETVELDLWVNSYRRSRVLLPFPSISILHASIPAIKSLVSATTQSFRIGFEISLPTIMPDLAVC